MDFKANTINKKLNKAFWEVETRVDKLFNYAAFPLLIIFIVGFFTHFDYMINREKRDFSALSPQLKSRLSDLEFERLKMQQQEDKLRKDINPWQPRDYNREIRAEIRVIASNRYQIDTEIQKIINQAPHTSWAYNLYAALGVIDKKEI